MMSEVLMESIEYEAFGKGFVYGIIFGLTTGSGAGVAICLALGVI